MFIDRASISIPRMIPYFIISFFSSAFEAQSTQLALPEIYKELGISVALSQWFSSVSIITKAAFAIPLTSIGVAIGAKTSICICQVICAVTCVLMLFAKQFWQLLLIKVLMGAVQTCTMYCNQFLIQNLLSDDREKRLVFMRRQRIVVSLINACSPLLASEVIEHLGWRANYIIIASGCVCRTLFVWLCIAKVDRQSNRSSFLNQFVLILALLSVSVGFTLISFKLVFWAVMLIMLAIPLTAIFMYCENISARKIFDRDQRSMISVSLAAVLALMGTIQSCEGLLSPQYFDAVFGRVDFLGMVNSAKALGSFIIIVVIQSLLQKRKLVPTKLIKWCSLLSTCCVVLTLASSSNIWTFTAFMALRQLVATPIYITLRPIMVVMVPKSTMHKITSLSSTMQTLGNCLVRALCSMILQLSSGQYSGEQYWVSIALSYVFVSAIAIGVVILVFMVLSRNKQTIDESENGSDSETQSLGVVA